VPLQTCLLACALADVDDALSVMLLSPSSGSMGQPVAQQAMASHLWTPQCGDEPLTTPFFLSPCQNLGKAATLLFCHLRSQHLMPRFASPTTLDWPRPMKHAWPVSSTMQSSSTLRHCPCRSWPHRPCLVNLVLEDAPAEDTQQGPALVRQRVCHASSARFGLSKPSFATSMGTPRVRAT